MGSSAARRSFFHASRFASTSRFASSDWLTAVDPVARTPYVRRFERECAAAKWRPVDERRVLAAAARADVALLGEYHPLPSAAHTAMKLLGRWRESGAACALALEMVHARDQRALDDFVAHRASEAELKRRIRYREEWGYPWKGLGSLLRLARELRIRVVGLDVPPRGGASDLALRDTVSAERIAALLRESQKLRIAVIFGEAHLATAALPARLAACAHRPVRVVRLLHDLEQVGGAQVHAGWMAAGPDTFAQRGAARGARVRALARTWRSWAADMPGPGEIDLPQFVHGLIEAQCEAALIEPRRFRVGPARWLADLAPEVFGIEERRVVARILARSGRGVAERLAVIEAAERRGAAYDARDNVVVVARASLAAAAVETARWLLAVLRGAVGAAARDVESTPRSEIDDTLVCALAALVEPRLDLRKETGISRASARAGRRIAAAILAARLSRRRLRAWLANAPRSERAQRRFFEAVTAL